MTNTQFYPDATAMIAALSTEILSLNELISRMGIDLSPHDRDTVELAEINLCFAETLQHENDEQARHYARTGLTEIRKVAPPC